MEQKMASKYTFTRIRPPLLVDEPDSWLVPARILTWESEPAVWWATRREGLTHYWTRFSLKRALKWVPEGPIHRVKDWTEDRKVTEGYNRVARKEFESFVEIGAGLDLPQLGLKADIKKTLKVTEEIRTEWKEESENIKHLSFFGGVTYVIWKLLDVFSVQKDTFADFWQIEPNQPPRVVRTQRLPKVETTFSCVVKGEYEDCDDPAKCK
jgi:hypothetical protein